MRLLIRHFVTILVISFILKVAIQAQDSPENNGVPKSLLLGSLAPSQAIPSGKIDSRAIIAAIRKE